MLYDGNKMKIRCYVRETKQGVMPGDKVLYEEHAIWEIRCYRPEEGVI